jgi:toxin ParE1/3/4
VTPITWSPQALRDVESIRDYIAMDSPRYADLVVSRIIASVDRLEVFPDSGRIVPERGEPQIREVIVRPYRVVYRRRANGVEVATVFRASRLLPDIE